MSKALRGSHLDFHPPSTAPLLLQVLPEALLLPRQLCALQLRLPIRLGLLHTWLQLLLLLGLLG